MKEEPDFYKRDEDRKWRERTDERVNGLTTGDNVQNDRLDQIEDGLASEDKILRGDPDGGLIQKIAEMEAALRRLNAIMWPDATGNSGLISDVRKLKKNEDREEKQSEYRWKFWTAVVVAFLSLVGLTIKIWPDIRPHLPHDDGKTAYEMMTTPAKPKKKHRRVKAAPPEEETNGEPQASD